MDLKRLYLLCPDCCFQRSDKFLMVRKDPQHHTTRLQLVRLRLYCEDVAGYLKVHLVTVYNWVKTRKIECYVLTKGKRKSTVRFDIEQIQKFIRSRNMG